MLRESRGGGRRAEDFCNFPSSCALLAPLGPAGIRLLVPGGRGRVPAGGRGGAPDWWAGRGPVQKEVGEAWRGKVGTATFEPTRDAGRGGWRRQAWEGRGRPRGHLLSPHGQDPWASFGV